MKLCTLCGNEVIEILTFRDRKYFQCNNCGSIIMDPKFHIDNKKEKERYELHNTTIDDEGYINFIKPITDYVIENFNSTHMGLDFGSGEFAVLSEFLRRKGYNILNYDPYFNKDKSLLNKKYDLIISCEVVEHFYDPKDEFCLLKSLLKENGKLIIKTDLIKENTIFENWYYKNDETHVFFYSSKTFEYIKKWLGFKKLKIVDRLIILTN